jgi:hypothetical protein
MKRLNDKTPLGQQEEQELQDEDFFLTRFKFGTVGF